MKEQDGGDDSLGAIKDPALHFFGTSTAHHKIDILRFTLI
jgi:hypothetical protein